MKAFNSLTINKKHYNSMLVYWCLDCALRCWLCSKHLPTADLAGDRLPVTAPQPLEMRFMQTGSKAVVMSCWADTVQRLSLFYRHLIKSGTSDKSREGSHLKTYYRKVWKPIRALLSWDPSQQGDFKESKDLTFVVLCWGFFNAIFKVSYSGCLKIEIRKIH